MVSVSRETPEQTDTRLRRVIGAADLVTLPGEWAYQESPREQPPVLDDAVLAVVRDEDTWCALRPATAATTGERLAVFLFHFPAGVDNSGFVGWLASVLKRELGTGVAVVCGSNSGAGGIYDYWGVPVDLAAQATRVIDELRATAGGPDTGR